MKLKLKTGLGNTIVGKVLIVPLWNWNKMAPSFLPVAFSCSNRTFMELKYIPKAYSKKLSVALIVSLWNWNQYQ